MRSKQLVRPVTVLWLVIILSATNLFAAGAAQSPSVITPVPELVTEEAPLIEQDGLLFKDLNKNGILDPYEDWRLSAKERANDLVEKMSYEEKAAQMIHLTLFSPRETWFKDDNVGFGLAYEYLADDPYQAALKANELQQWSESSKWGIPLIISMDSIIGASWVRGATLYPDQIGLAATRDVELVRKLSEMQRKEMLALGVRMSLSPIADLATDPRWGRFQECFGEDVDLATEMVVAVIEGLQAGNELSEDSIMVSVKHFPGSGPQENGVDGSPIIFDQESLNIHLTPFKAAIEAGAGSIMPYGYSKVPFLGGDAKTRNAHESHTVMTELLVEQLGYEGLIQTDWGMKHLDSAQAGAHILGGAGLREIPRLAENLTAEEIDTKVRKILEAKFKMGLFENPYVDPAYAAEVVGNDEHMQLAYEAAVKSFTLLKHKFEGSLTKDSVILTAGALMQDADALNSGWKIEHKTALTIEEALRLQAFDGEVIPLELETLSEISGKADAAVFVMGETASTHQPPWGVANLDIPQEELAMLEAVKEEGVPIISVIVLSRPYVLTEVLELSDSVLVVYRPGVSMGAQAIADALFGKTPINGKLPVQLPASLEQVTRQREDLPFDLVNPLFEFGDGIEVIKF